MNYYNDNDPECVAWLEQLVADGLIPPGVVDGRSIDDVRPEDLDGFTQCHFFAGVGGWPLALTLAGIPSTEPVWTGSCPCQPFSGAGRGRGAADPRHKWPAWFALIEKCRPARVFGEQVDKAAGRTWMRAVQADVETLGYAWGGADLCAAGVGAPHIRQRSYWVAHAQGNNGRARLCDSQPGRERGDKFADSGCHSSGMGDTFGIGQKGECRGGEERVTQPSQNGYWDGCGWVLCVDPEGKKFIRPAEPGTFPVDNGLPAKLVKGLLHGYGNAIVPQVAAAFIEAAWEV